MSVVSLRGDPVGNPHEPDQNVVAFLEEQVLAARSGEINGIVVAIGYADGAWSYGFSGQTGNYGMAGALEVAKAHIVGRIRGVPE